MKKLCYVLFCVMFLTSNQGVFAKNLSVDTPQKAKKVKLEKKDLPSFFDIYSIMENKYVQDGVRVLQYNLLKLLRSIGLTTSEKEKVEKIRGNKKDIDEAKRRIDYLASLEMSLENANTLERVKNVLGLNLKGKEAVKHALSVIRSVRDADSLQKVRDIPEINENVSTEIDEYELLKKIMKEADSVEKLKNIPGINPKSIEKIREMEGQSAKIESLNDVKDISNSPVIDARVKDQISALLEMEIQLKKADSLDKLKVVPNVNSKIISYIDGQITENKKLKDQIKDHKKTEANLNYRLENALSDSEKERRFFNSLVSAILRALIGFDYRSRKSDFARSKEKKIVNGTALVAAARNSISHLGGKEEDLFAITNGLQDVLRTLLTNKEWVKEIESIKKQLENISVICNKFNNDAEIMKLNVNYAVDVASSLLGGSRRPPRDTIKNFDDPNQKIQVEKTKDLEEVKQPAKVEQSEEVKQAEIVDEQVSDKIKESESTDVQESEKVKPLKDVDEQISEDISQSGNEQMTGEIDQSEDTEPTPEETNVQTEELYQDSEVDTEA